MYSVLHALHPPLMQNITKLWKKPSHRHMLLNITQVAEDPGLRSDTDLKKKKKKCLTRNVFLYNPNFLFGENIYANRKLTWY